MIINGTHTPYYLQKEYGGKSDKDRKLRAGAIYTRVADINTPKESTANIEQAEYLWRKRFGIDQTPFARMKQYLQENSWSDADWSNRKTSFYSYYLEYQIVAGEAIDYYENLRYFYDDVRMLCAPLNLQYLSTTLYETQLWYMDMGRCILPKPQKMVIESYMYYYFYLNDIDGMLLKRFTNLNCQCANRSGLPIPIMLFHNEPERIRFLLSVTAEEIDKAWANIKDSPILQRRIAEEESEGKHQIGSVKDIAILYEVYKNWQHDNGWMLDP